MPAAQAELPYKIVGGVVPCDGGWLLAGAKLKGATFVPEFPRVVENLHDAVQRRPAFTVVALNAPIGGAADALTASRSCDVLASELIGRPLAQARWGDLAPVLAGGDDGDADGGEAARLLRTRYAEVVAVIAPYLQRTVCEVVPELVFYQLNGERPVPSTPFTPEGYAERRELLSRVAGISRVLDANEPGVTPRQLLEVSALIWSARRISARAAKRVPHLPEWDEHGLRIEILR